METFTRDPVSLAKFLKMAAACSSAKSEFRVNSADFEMGENPREKMKDNEQ